MSFLPTDASQAYEALLLEAIELSDKFAQRLEELYRKYPSASLGETIERLRGLRHRLNSPENPRDQDCAPHCSGNVPVTG
jgi:hypothetical protein